MGRRLVLFDSTDPSHRVSTLEMHANGRGSVVLKNHFISERRLPPRRTSKRYRLQMCT